MFKDLSLSLEKEMTTHSSTLAWKIPWMEEPVRLQSMGLRRVRDNWSNAAAAAYNFYYWFLIQCFHHQKIDIVLFQFLLISKWLFYGPECHLSLKMFYVHVSRMLILMCWLSSVQLLHRVWLFVTPWITARQASLSITKSQSPLKLMSIESVMPSKHLILCCPLLLPPSIFPSIRVFSSESVLCIRWPKYN